MFFFFFAGGGGILLSHISQKAHRGILLLIIPTPYGVRFGGWELYRLSHGSDFNRRTSE